jgi:hypothetical protein
MDVTKFPFSATDFKMFWGIVKPAERNLQKIKHLRLDISGANSVQPQLAPIASKLVE